MRIPVLAQERVGKSGYVLRFSRPWNFTPGQLTGLSLLPGMAPRSYSIASSPHADVVDILYTVVEDGVLTPSLSLLRPGDTLLAAEPFGSFRDLPGPAVWIANGTGVAPFLSMLRFGIEEPRVLVQGSRTWADLFYPEELAAYRHLQWVPCLSGEEHEGAFNGRLTVYVKNRDWSPQSRYLLCGSAGMVSEVRDILISKGVPLERIVGEIYF